MAVSAPPFRPSMVSRTTRHLCCHLNTSGAPNTSGAKSSIGRSFLTIFGIKKNIVVQTFCGHRSDSLFCFSQETPPLLLSPLSTNPYEIAVATTTSHFPSSLPHASSLCIGIAFSLFSGSSILRTLMLQLLHLRVTLTMLCPLSFLPQISPKKFRIFLFSLQNVHSSSPR